MPEKQVEAGEVDGAEEVPSTRSTPFSTARVSCHAPAVVLEQTRDRMKSPLGFVRQVLAFIGNQQAQIAKVLAGGTGHDSIA
jgi:hypothetical protein